jgi:hypothetical protein
MAKEYNLDDELGIGSLFDDIVGDSMEYPPVLTKLTKSEREYVLTMAYREIHFPEVKFSPLTHCALCGRMSPSVAVSVRNHVPLNYTIKSEAFWNESVCNCHEEE